MEEQVAMLEEELRKERICTQAYRDRIRSRAHADLDFIGTDSMTVW